MIGVGARGAIVVLGVVSAACSSVDVLDLFPAELASAGAPGSEPTSTGGAGGAPLVPALVVSELVDLSVAGAKDCADGGAAVAYSVLDLDDDAARVTPRPAPGCLAPGDELLLINLQGRQDATANVGRHELVRVASVTADVVRFDAPKTAFYGAAARGDDHLGTGIEQQRVVLQRVPRYSRLEVTPTGILTAQAWDGERGGLLVLRVDGEALIDGVVTMSGAGYRGGVTTEPPESPGQQGESIGGLGDFRYAPNLGGGGGGIADQTTSGCQQDGYPGGGGAHWRAGSSAEVRDLCDGLGAGEGGARYGVEGRLTFGSGGGSAGTDNIRSDNPPGGAGGPGGGVIWILAASITGEGVITADGAAGVGDPPGVECLGGAVDECYDHSGPGGGGAGGLVRLMAASVSVATVSARGGPGGNGNDEVAGNGGDGGDGWTE